MFAVLKCFKEKSETFFLKIRSHLWVQLPKGLASRSLECLSNPTGDFLQTFLTMLKEKMFATSPSAVDTPQEHLVASYQLAMDFVRNSEPRNFHIYLLDWLLAYLVQENHQPDRHDAVAHYRYLTEHLNELQDFYSLTTKTIQR